MTKVHFEAGAQLATGVIGIPADSRRRATRLLRRRYWLAALLVVPIILNGCGIVERLTGEAARKQARAEEAKQRIEALQQKVMRYADQYVEQLSSVTEILAQQTGNPNQVIDILNWRFTNSMSAVQIAAGPNPITNAVDMVVMVSLSRHVVENTWPGVLGDRAQPALDTYLALEKEAWRLVEGIGTEAEQAELRSVLDRWYREYPDLRSAAFIRFADFAGAGARAKIPVSPGLLGIVGLDPLAGIDPAVQQVEQARQLAERSVYYAQRLPVLLGMQTSLAAARFGSDPQVRGALQAVEQVGDMSASMDHLVQQAPEFLSREREAAIAQFMGELQQQQHDMLALATQLRGALEAGTLTAGSLDALIQSTDRLMARFEPDPNAPPPAGPARPFDINEYTRAIVELAVTAREFQTLLNGADGLAPQLAAQADQIGQHARGLVDYAFLRLLLLIVAAFAATVSYRLVANRLNRGTGAADQG